MVHSKFNPCAVLVLASLWLMTGNATAQSVVRSWGMGGTGAATSRGLNAVALNPANLAFSHGSTLGLAAVAADVRNNSFSLQRYNQISGQHLDSAAKAQLLGDIPQAGFALDGTASASVLGFQSGPFALSVQGFGAGRGNLDKNYLELALNGNQFGQTLDFNNTWGQGYAVGSAAVSYGKKVMDHADTQISFGLNARYLRGLYEMHVTDAHGSLSTGLNALAGEVYVASTSATGGRGYGLDLGLAVQTAGWQIGLAVDNVVGTVNWSTGAEQRQLQLTAAGVSLTNGDLNKAVANADTTFAAAAYSTSLPRQARLGAAHQLGSFLVEADYVQNFATGGVTSARPLISTGVEWRPLSFCHPRLGLASGGERGNSVSAGMGLKLGPWQIDAAAVSHGSLTPGNNKGLALALGSQLEF